MACLADCYGELNSTVRGDNKAYQATLLNKFGGPGFISNVNNVTGRLAFNGMLYHFWATI